MTRALGVGLSLLYDGESIVGWSAGMRAVTRALLEGGRHPSGAVLEVGCGGGVLLASLLAQEPERLHCGVDRSGAALALAATRSPQPALVQGDLSRLPLVDRCVSVLLALDAFDQRGVDLGAALAESCRVLVEGGLLVVRVSAHPWLAGPHDTAFNTGRRFSRRTLAAALLGAGFELQRITYANALLAPPIVLLRLLQRWSVLPLGSALYSDPFINRLLAVGLADEARWLRRRNLPFGLSLYALARKREL